MAYDEGLAERVRDALAREPDVSEKKMFGGLCLLVGGKMCAGVVGQDLMVRVGADGHAAALARPGARPMDFTGRPMKGFVYVAPDGLASDAALAAWLALGVAGAREADVSKPRARAARIGR